ncbi:Proteolipid membrane potential modulator domain containing protein [Naviculisporaceae sp. PSN 640]
MCSSDIFLGLLAILFPPLAVWVKRGICSADSIINILLLILGYIPGLIHAWYIIAKYPDPTYEYAGPLDAENGRGTYYVFVRDNRGGGHHVQRHQPKPLNAQGAMNYGTNAVHAAGSSSHTPAPPKQQVHPPQQSGQVPVEPQHHDDAAGPSNGPPPPSYAQVVAGDHKVQSHD